VDDEEVEKRREEDDDEEEKKREDDDEKVWTPRTELLVPVVKSRVIEKRDICYIENTREYINSIRTTRKIYKDRAVMRDCSCAAPVDHSKVVHS